MRNRIVLFSLALLAWLALKAIDIIYSGPQILLLLSLAVLIMVAHSLWLLSAQKHWQKKIVKHQLTGYHKVRPRLSKQSLDNFQDSSDWHPWVDIFISAKNESRVIEATIRKMFKLEYDKFFVWVINDCSTDDTAKILQQLTNEFAGLRVINRIPGSYPGKSAALNEALPLAKGDVIAVFDADAYVAPDFLKIMLPILAPEEIGAVQAQKRIYEQQQGLLIECQSSEYALDTYFQVGRDLIGGAVELRGNGQLIKRAALIDVGGWNNQAITDDLDLSMRLLTNHWDIRICPHAYVYEEGVTTIKALIRQRRRWAEGSIRRYLDYILPLNSPTRLSFVERFDTLAFTVLFVVPALLFLETCSEIIQYSLGMPTHGVFLITLICIIFFVSQLNVFTAIRIYGKKSSVLKTLSQTSMVSTYLYLHWMPCVFYALTKIIFGKKVSTWHPTEHIGQPSHN